MPITIKYEGRLGNNLFQYTFARLYAQYNNIYFDNIFHYQHILDVTEYKYCKHDLLASNQPMLITDDNSYDIYNTLTSIDHNFICHGFFQDHIFYTNKPTISKFFKLKDNYLLSKNYDDIVIHLRLNDYPKNIQIDPNWYINILEREKFNKLYIVIQQSDTNDLRDQYFEKFKQFNYEIVSNKHDVYDFYFIMSFNKMILSNSTFAWWAAFFSNADYVYTFKPWINHKNVNLAPAYNWIPCNGSFLQ